MLPLLYFNDRHSPVAATAVLQRAPFTCRCHRCTSSSTTHLLLSLLYFNERHSPIAATTVLQRGPLTCFIHRCTYLNMHHSPAAATAVQQMRQRVAVRHSSLFTLLLGVAEVGGRPTRHARLCNKTVWFLHCGVIYRTKGKTLMGNADDIVIRLQKEVSDRHTTYLSLTLPLQHVSLTFPVNRRPILFIRMLTVITTC